MLFPKDIVYFSKPIVIEGSTYVVYILSGNITPVEKIIVDL